MNPRSAHTRIPAVRWTPSALLLLPALLAAACSTGEGSETESEHDTSNRDRTPIHIDSIFPVEEELRRFRVGLEEPASLAGGDDSIEALVDRYLRALETGDTDVFPVLALDRSEFAWFYYPHTMYLEPPYELSPALVWYQLQNQSARGLTRALNQYAGETLHDTGIECPDPPELHGSARIHHGCRVVGELPDGQVVREVLFGSILELDGRFKFVGFANEL